MTANADTHEFERVFLALGANIGARDETLVWALDEMKLFGGLSFIRCSKPREYAALTLPHTAKQPPYLNIVVELLTTHSPEQLLKYCAELEIRAGRTKVEKWGPRVLDIDIILYGDRKIMTHDLRVPHGEMHKRVFVLEPMCDIAPEVIHPVLKKSMRQLLSELTQVSA